MVGRVVIVGGYPVYGSGRGHPDVGDVVIGVEVLLPIGRVMAFGADGELGVAGLLVSDEDERGSIHVGEFLVVVDDGLGDELVDGPRVVVLAVAAVVASPLMVVLSHGYYPCGVGVYWYCTPVGSVWQSALFVFGVVFVIDIGSGAVLLHSDEAG